MTIYKSDREAEVLDEIIKTLNNIHKNLKSLTIHNDIKIDEIFVKVKTEDLSEIINCLYAIKQEIKEYEE